MIGPAALAAGPAPAPPGGSRGSVRSAVLESGYTGNQLLNALLRARADALSRLAERIQLDSGALLHRPGQPLAWAYFPAGAVLSVQQALASGGVTEICAHGADAMAGLGACLSASAVYQPQLVVTLGGPAYRTRIATLRRALLQPGPAQDMLLRYMQSELERIGQLSACACLHGTEQRLCRWLLGMGAHSPAAVLDITHDQLAMLLGVRRESVTEALRRLRQLGVLRTGRGRLAVSRPDLLQALACECHEVLQRERLRLQAELRRLAEGAAHGARQPHGGAGVARLSPVRWQSRS